MRNRVILLILFVFITILAGDGQTQTKNQTNDNLTPAKFKQKYGSPDAKGRYIVRPNIGLSIEYKQGQNPSEMVIKPLDSDTANVSNPEKKSSRKVIPSDEAEEVLNELVPVAKRGKKGFVGNLLSGCTFGDHTEYEQVTISIIKRCDRQGGGTY